MAQIIEVPGIGQVEFPDGMSDADIVSAIKRNSGPNPQERAAVSPVEGMSTLQKFGAAYGGAAPMAALGIKQAIPPAPTTQAMLSGPVDLRALSQRTGERSQQIQGEIDEARRLNAPLMETGAGLAGNLLGNAALAAPLAMAPGANTYMGAGALNAMLGAAQPTATGESRTANTALGGAAGIAGQGIGRLAGRLIRPVQSGLTPEQEAIASVARRENIPLSVGQETGSKPLKIMESVMENMPFTAGKQAAAKQAQQSAFTGSVLRRAGIEGETAATPGVLAGRKAALGKTFEDIASGAKLNFNQGLTDDLAGIVAKANQELTPADAGRVARQVDSIISQVDEAGNIAGSQYQAWRQPLNRLAKGGSEAGHYFGEIKKALDKSFSSQISGGEAEAWKTASRQYANLKTISDAMGGAGAGTKAGVVSPAQLEGALTKSIGREGKALGRGDLNELVGVGRTFVSESVPDSGTAQREFWQRVLTGNVPGAIGGAGLGYYGGRTPESAMAGAAIGAGSTLLLPKLIQSAIQSPAGSKYLTGGLMTLSPGELAILSTTTRMGMLGATPLLTGGR